MPLNDWQFWVVTILALSVVLLGVRAVWPKPKGRHSVQLTMDRKPVAKAKGRGASNR